MGLSPFVVRCSVIFFFFFFFSSRRRHTRFDCDWSSDVCSSDLKQQRPMLFVLNLGDDEAAELDTAVERHKLGALQGRKNTAVVAVCGRLEAELAEMDEKEAAELLSSYGLKEPGLNRLIRATYDLMGLIQFFTAGEPEVRAWTIRKGSTAAKAAGEIHSDIEKGFIRAEVVRWNDLLAAGSIAAAREKAQVRLEGREYLVQEGDVILFRHSG